MFSQVVLVLCVAAQVSRTKNNKVMGKESKPLICEGKLYSYILIAANHTSIGHFSVAGKA